MSIKWLNKYFNSVLKNKYYDIKATFFSTVYVKVNDYEINWTWAQKSAIPWGEQNFAKFRS